ncbi:hypothetical protein D777_02108 [Marinobacter nitratireducens]|uniref:Sulfatase-modifying factor enzyme-like domain-containing protein n=1 Tax=Marinobacter nitratireducens TaxID=1137280 RepID=A0A072NCX8_9GAMM|nr:SUMF1/EgtB/PvdO family nonheme iron enzyme [Marinobacter nitratireducens]KEF30955.1 hypothetical protein D777_02108 [Marinobacter nitratireducens]
MRAFPWLGAIVLTPLYIQLTGCDALRDWQKIEMVQRNLDNMVFVEGGEFLMGNTGGWAMGADTIPAHEVVLDDFYIQKFEVTQEDFEVFVETSGHTIKARFYEDKRSESPERFEGELPAPVSWHDAKAFCRWLGEQSGHNVDLPTEAQWEYAARSRGQMVRHATDNGELLLGLNINSEPLSFLGFNRTTLTPPGTFPANPLGLYDMSGNAEEWVNDYYQPDYYQYSEKTNPKGPDSGRITPHLDEPERVIRGSRYGDTNSSSTVIRREVSESIMPLASGFRCVRN